ncbi:MAG: hypothetical protein ACRDFC_04510 [Ignavibacteria bacterium]
MKRTLIVFLFVVSFNFTGPEITLINVKYKHLIEYIQDAHKRELSDNEVLKNKFIIYLELQFLKTRVENINHTYSFYFNTS